MLEQNAMACNRYYQLIRNFAIRCKPWELAIRHEVQPDEIRDITLISQRVYNTREEFFAVMAAAGMASVELPLTVQQLVLPTLSQLAHFKQLAGYENNHKRRLFTGLSNNGNK